MSTMLIDTRGNAFMIVGVKIQYSFKGDGQFELIVILGGGGPEQRIGCSRPDEKTLPKVRDHIVWLMGKGQQVIDLRDCFMTWNSDSLYDYCTIVPK